MDQRSDDIRQDIEATRASLDEKLDTLEIKARQAFDLKHQVAERPWMAVGAAVAAGFVLGSLGSGEPEQRWHGQPYYTTDYNQHAGASQGYGSSSYGSNSQDSSRSSTNNLLSQFDEEIDLLKVAAINLATNFLRDSIKEYLPALGQQLLHGDQSQPQTQPRGSSVSTAPGASRYADMPSTEDIPVTTSYGENTVDRQAEHAAPYYPPGSNGGARERTVGDKSTTF
jgi:hypothetical protein